MTDVTIASGIVWIGIARLFIRLRSLEHRLDRLSRLDAKVEALLRHAGVEFDPFADEVKRRTVDGATRS